MFQVINLHHPTNFDRMYLSFSRLSIGMTRGVGDVCLDPTASVAIIKEDRTARFLRFIELSSGQSQVVRLDTGGVPLDAKVSSYSTT